MSVRGVNIGRVRPGLPTSRLSICFSSLAMASIPLLAANFDFLRQVGLRALQLDLEHAVEEACLNLVGMDTKRELHRPRECPVADFLTVTGRFAIDHFLAVAP